METQSGFTAEPLGFWDIDSFDALLNWCHENNASDIVLLPKSPVWCRIYGTWQAITKKNLTSDEIMNLIDITSRNPSASASLKGGNDIDYAYEVNVDKITRRRFRANASACRDGWSIGASLVMRMIPSLPPTIEELGVEDELISHLFPNNGLVLVTGVMGSGKSTLLSAILRHIIENQHKHIVTYEAPIEFDLMGIKNQSGPIIQTSIPEHLSDFTSAPRNSARRAADVILVGESRDPETLRGMIESSEIGVAAYSTVHTRSVAETPARIINVFPSAMHNQIATTLISSLRVIIQQRLLARADEKGRIAVKEYLVFNSLHRDKLYDVSIDEIIPTIKKMVEEDGQPLVVDAQKKFKEGLISKDDLVQIETETIKHP